MSETDAVAGLVQATDALVRAEHAVRDDKTSEERQARIVAHIEAARQDIDRAYREIRGGAA